MNRLFGFLTVVVVLASPVIAADKGAQLFKDKKYAEAETALRSEVQAAPESADANYYLGATLNELGKYKDAEPYLKKAAPAMPTARVELAHSYMMEDKLNDALGELKAVEKQEAKNPDLYRYRGMIQLKQNQPKEASDQLSKAIELDPKDAYAYYYLGMASSKQKRTDLMIKNFRMFLELAPDAPEAEKVRSLLRSL